MDLFSLLQNQIGYFLLAFARISGIFSTAPVFGSRNVPIYIKAGMSLLFTYILFPALEQNAPAIPDSLLPYLFLAVSEFLLGVIFGYAASMIFTAVQMAGTLLDTQIGFGIVNVFDPQFGQQVPLIGNFKYILALIVFLSVNGHHVLLSALFASFRLVPLTAIVFHSGLAELMVNMVSAAFTIAFKLSIPVLAALFLTDVALGILARTMPQMNIFAVGIPGKLFIGIFVLSLALPFYILFLEVGFNGMYQDIYRLLALLQ